MRLPAVPRYLLFLLLSSLGHHAASGADATANPADEATLPIPSAMDHYLANAASVVETYCLDCHNEDYQEGEVDLSAFDTPETMAANQGLWRRVMRMVKFSAMPPGDAEPLSDEQRETLFGSLSAALDEAACSQNPKPGKVTVRRLNRVEYDNTLSDLFGHRISVAEDFPQDEVGAGFDNNGDVLSIPPMLFEKYMSAAEQISRQVISDPASTGKETLRASHQQLLTVTPGKGRSAHQAAKECLEPFLRRAFRGPVDEATVDRYASLAEMATEREKSFERGMQVAVSAILVSPRFLFRSELDDPTDDAKPGDVLPIEDHHLASRLSYFLWSSMPDEELLGLADQGRLNDEAVLRTQVQRMIADERRVALSDNFAAQWLSLRNLDGVEPDVEKFPQFDDALRNDMRTETLMLFQDVVDNNRSIVTLLDSTETFLNERLAKHYGIGGVQGDDFRRVSVRDHGRAGILTHASVLTLTSFPGRTSPVLRGKWVLENLLGMRPPDPPPGTPELAETSKANPNASLRLQLEQHRADPACASCHVVMDDIGFALDHFGPIGNYRSDDEGRPIDATGTLPGGRSFDGALAMIRQLRDAETASFVETVANRLLTYALGRELTVTDTCFLVEIVAESAKHDHQFVDLAIAVVLSKPFRYHTLEEN